MKKSLPIGPCAAESQSPAASLPRRAALASAIAAVASVPALAAAVPGAGGASVAPGASVAALGGTIRQLWAQHERLDLAWCGLDAEARAICRAEMDATFDHAEALSVAALRIRARTAADGAVQAAIVVDLLEILASSGMSDHANETESTLLRACIAGAASLTLLLSGAARLRVAELGPPDVRMTLDREFPGAVRAAG
jgi:hypothetical protein